MTAWSGKVTANLESGVPTGVAVRKGDIISIVASGWVECGSNASYPLGPQGQNGRRDNGLVCSDACMGALLVELKHGIYPINAGDLLWEVPEHGELVFLVNDLPGTYGNNTGGFDVMVKLEQPHAGLGHRQPPPKQWSGKVDATQAKGLATGISLKKGDSISVSASGWVTLNNEADSHSLGPQGMPDDKRHGGALYMTIGGHPVLVGTGMLDWTVPAGGGLTFYVQDDCYTDNSGAFDVKVVLNGTA